MAEQTNLRGEWKALAEYAEELSVQEQNAGAGAEKAKKKKEMPDEGNEIERVDDEEKPSRRLHEKRSGGTTKGAAPPKPSNRLHEKRSGAGRPTEKGGHTSRLRLSEKYRRQSSSRPSEKDRQSKRSVSRRLPSEERNRQLRWLRNETWLTLNAKAKGASLEDLLKKLSMDGYKSVESRIKTLGYPNLAAFLNSAYMQHEVEVVCREGRTIYLSKNKKGSSTVEKKLKDSEHRLKKLKLHDSGKPEGDPDSKVEAAAPQEAPVLPAEKLPEGEALVLLAEEKAQGPKKNAEEPPENAEAPKENAAAEGRLQEEDGPKADEPLPVQQKAAELPGEDVEMPAEQAVEEAAEEPIPADVLALAVEVIEEANGQVDTREMVLLGEDETPEKDVAMAQKDRHRRRTPAVADLASLDRLLFPPQAIRQSFVPIGADRRFKWQRLFQPREADIAVVPPAAEREPPVMRPALELVLEALQRQQNPEAPIPS